MAVSLKTIIIALMLFTLSVFLLNNVYTEGLGIVGLTQTQTIDNELMNYNQHSNLSINAAGQTNSDLGDDDDAQDSVLLQSYSVVKTIYNGLTLPLDIFESVGDLFDLPEAVVTVAYSIALITLVFLFVGIFLPNILGGFK